MMLTLAFKHVGGDIGEGKEASGCTPPFLFVFFHFLLLFNVSMFNPSNQNGSVDVLHHVTSHNLINLI